MGFCQMSASVGPSSLLKNNKLLGRVGNDIVHGLMNDTFGNFSSFPGELRLLSSERFHPIVEKNPPHNARFAYDFLEPVTLSPAILAMNSCGARNLGAALIRLRIL